MIKKNSRYLIYADDYIQWNPKLGDWGYNDFYIGTCIDAHLYARNKYGKKYVIRKD